jgi:subtilase family serine protease
MTRRSRLAARPRLEQLDVRCVLSAVTPAQLDTAYGLNAITFSNGTIKGTGEGQTIAIIDAYNDPTIYSDLTAFDAKYGLSNPTLSALPAANSASSTAASTFTVVDQSAPTNSSWDTEEALDVEMAHAAAPGANIVLVEAPSATTTALIGAVEAAKTIPSVSVISMSWGSSEFYDETEYDSVFTTPAGHTGITFVAAAGDSGPGAEWPAASPNVVGVGGTSLVLSSTGTILSQTQWSSSGGGTSQVESKPTYQDSTVSGSYRSTPDVSLDADPNTGVVIVSQGQQEQVGGTSLSAPVFGGLIAIADQGLATVGKTSLDGATQTLPDLYTAKAGSFTAVASTTTTTRSRFGVQTKSAPTGLGSPNATTLVSSLTGLTTTTTTTTTGTGTTTTGTGTTTTGTGTTTTGTGGTTTTGTGGTTSTGGSNQGRGRWGFFGSSGSNDWWNSYFTNRFGL